MITVETPLKHLEIELAKLDSLERTIFRMYAQGAMDALQWVRDGGLPPSEKGLGGLVLFLTLPLVSDGAKNVH